VETFPYVYQYAPLFARIPSCLEINGLFLKPYEPTTIWTHSPEETIPQNRRFEGPPFYAGDSAQKYGSNRSGMARISPSPSTKAISQMGLSA
jgi:hypothetical protein